MVHSGWGQGCCIGDYDNDGFDDLYVTSFGKNVLYHNNGDGTFTDVSEKAGVEARVRAGARAVPSSTTTAMGDWISLWPTIAVGI